MLNQGLESQNICFFSKIVVTLQKINSLIVHNEDTIGIASKYDCSSFPTATYVSSYKADFRYMG